MYNQNIFFFFAFQVIHSQNDKKMKLDSNHNIYVLLLIFIMNKKLFKSFPRKEQRINVLMSYQKFLLRKEEICS